MALVIYPHCISSALVPLAQRLQYQAIEGRNDQQLSHQTGHQYAIQGTTRLSHAMAERSSDEVVGDRRRRRGEQRGGGGGGVVFRSPTGTYIVPLIISKFTKGAFSRA